MPFIRNCACPSKREREISLSNLHFKSEIHFNVGYKCNGLQTKPRENARECATKSPVDVIWTEASVNHKLKSRSRAKKEVMKKAKERESERT